MNRDINGIATDGNVVNNEDDRLDVDESAIDDSDRNELGIADGGSNNACIGIGDCIIDIHSHSDGEISSSSDSPDEVKYQGKRKYIQECVSEDTEAVVAEHVPKNIDGTSLFIVPLHNGELSNCKGDRPWGGAISSRLKTFKDGPRLIFKCRGSYRCINSQCKNICDFGINRKEFAKKKRKIVCTIYGWTAEYILCAARLILEENLKEKTVRCKHFGTHTCPLEFQGRAERKQLISFAENFSKVTREGIIRQQVQKTLETTSSYPSAVEVASMYTDTAFIDNVKARCKAARRPYGHSFEAVNILRESFSKDDKYLIYELDIHLS